MGQDKKNIDPRDCRNLLALEEESLIDSFKHEFLVLYNERKGSIVLTFIVTNDKMEGNGRVLLHIHSSPSSDLSTTDSTDSSRLASSLSNPRSPSLSPAPRANPSGSFKKVGSLVAGGAERPVLVAPARSATGRIPLLRRLDG